MGLSSGEWMSFRAMFEANRLILGPDKYIYVFKYSQCCLYDDVIMGAMTSQITSLTIAYSTFYSDADQRKHQSSVSLAFVRGSHRGPVNSPHKWPVTQRMSRFDEVIMHTAQLTYFFEEPLYLRHADTKELYHSMVIMYTIYLSSNCVMHYVFLYRFIKNTLL